MFCRTLDKKNIYYEVVGDLNAQDSIIFLNGLSQTTESWGLLIPFFEKKYKIVLMDFIFQGQSDKKGDVREFDMHAVDVLSVLDLLGIYNANMVGLSYGSIVAQHFAARYPDRLKHLILLSTFAHKTPFYEVIEYSWKKALKIGGYPHLLDVMLPYVLSEEYFENPIIPLDILKSAKQEFIHVKGLAKLMKATADRKDFRKELTTIQCPSLVVHGRKDRLFPVNFGEIVAAEIPNCAFLVLENAGHTLNLEAVNLVGPAIVEFIESNK